MVKISSLYLFFLFLNPILMVDPAAAQELRARGDFDCKDLGGSCIYRPVYATPETIIAKVITTLFNGVSLLGSRAGTLAKLDTQEIVFSYNDPNDPGKLEKIKQAILKFDARDNIGPQDIVIVRADIYEADENFGSELNAYINNFNSTRGNISLSGGYVAPGPTGTVSNGLSIATQYFSGFLLAQKTKGSVYTSNYAVVEVTNRDTYRFNFLEPTYTSFPNTPSNIKENDLGLNFSGTVDISGLKEGLILLQNPTLSFGVDSGEGRIVSTINISTSQIPLVSGISKVYVGAGERRSTAKSLYGLPHIRKLRVEARKEIVIALTATSMSFAESTFRSKNVSPDLTHASLNPEQVSALPDSGKSVEEIVDSLKPIATETSTGDRILGFLLDQNLLSKATYDTNIYLQIKGDKYTQNEFRDIQSLTTTPFNLDMKKFSLDVLQKPTVRLEVKFITFDSKKKDDKSNQKEKPFKIIHLILNTKQNKLLRVD